MLAMMGRHDGAPIASVLHPCHRPGFRLHPMNSAPDLPLPEPPGSNLPEISVSELAGTVKRVLEGAFDRVRVRGELGRVTIAKSGHLYADLKDPAAVVSIIMWKNAAGALKFRPEEGLEVVVEGRVTTWSGRSQYQLVADRMEPAGAGALMALLDERRKKLAAEGLFASERKRPIPFLPRVVGVVTSPTGAVIRDILHRLRERFPVEVLVWPVLVQGEKAAGQIAAAIRGFNALAPGDTGSVPRPDVLIVARGGGSIEDLWAFNEEIVVRAAAASEIPLISAVGHETDTTLIDFVADLRAPTPTGAAEKAVPVRMDLLAGLGELAGRKDVGMRRLLDTRRMGLEASTRRLRPPGHLLAEPTQRLDHASAILSRALVANLRAHERGLAGIAARLNPMGLVHMLVRQREKLGFLGERNAQGLLRSVERRRDRYGPLGQRLAPAMTRILGDHAKALENNGKLLESLSHRAVLMRGYSVVRRSGGEVVMRADALAPGEHVLIGFSDGSVSAEIRGPKAGDAANPPPNTPADPNPPPKAPRPKTQQNQGSLF